MLDAGRRLIAAIGQEPRFSPTRFNSMAIDRVSDDPGLKAALFRLVDVTPMCRDDSDVAEHLVALLGEIEGPQRLVSGVRRVSGSRRVAPLAGRVARGGVRRMASRFIVGEDAGSALPELTEMWDRGVASTVDLLGEATVTEREADAYARRCEETLLTLVSAAARWPERPHLERDAHGVVPRANLSVKVSAMTPNARADDPARGVRGAADRLRSLLRVARDNGAHVHIDMESLDLRETVGGLVFELLAEPEFREGPSAGMVLQGYLLDSAEELEDWLDWQRSSDRRTPLTIRLVKGAYWDQEVVEAAQNGWPAPVFTDRSACDRNFEDLTVALLGRLDLVRPAIASHNLRSISHAIAAAEVAGDAALVEFQVLRGLGDDIERALAKLGHRVRTYSPVGDLIAGMAYLVRRLLENTSNDSFLRARAQSDNLDSLLVAP